MFKKNINFLKANSCLIVFFIFTSIFGLFTNFSQAEWADHLVISAVQITEGEGKTNHDFIEIYNPTANDINLKGYRLVKRTKIGSSDVSIKSWTDDAVIKAHSWRLWASSDDEAYSIGLGVDDATKQTVAPDNGIAIRFGAADTGEIIDSLAWGEAENIFKESVAAPNLGVSEVLVRNSGIIGAGNGEDTNNNIADFSVIISYNSHNSQSAPMPVLEEIFFEEPSLNQTPAALPTPEAGFTPSQATGADQKILPIADAGSDKEAVIGENLDFDASDSFDSTAKELSFVWDFGDKTSAKGLNVSHVYREVGDYEVILKVDNGMSVAEDRLKVRITTPEYSNKIILNEILPNPIGADKDGEWIELYNSGESRINLKGWIIAAGAKSGEKQYIFSSDSFIEPKNFFLLKRGASGLVLVNENGKVVLKWSNDKIMSEVSYNVAKEGKSYSFQNNSWQWSETPTPGKLNSSGIDSSAVIGSKNKSSPVSAVIKVNQADIVDFQTQEITGESEMSDFEQNTNVLSAQPGSIIGVEEFLDRLIAEKVEKAFLKAKEEFVLRDESEVIVNDSQQDIKMAVQFGSDQAKYTANIGLNSANDAKNIRNNPWFYGDLALSALSLYLVWRYQEVRKKLKN